MAESRHIVHYLDMPIQHINDRVLKSMNRKGNRAVIESAVARLRAAMPDITLRTTLLVGYPGETEEEYGELCEFVKTARFERLGCFAFSAICLVVIPDLFFRSLSLSSHIFLSSYYDKFVCRSVKFGY